MIPALACESEVQDPQSLTEAFNMASNFAVRLGLFSVTLAALIGSGCGSSDKSASIKIDAPEKDAQLTLKSDLDPDKDGLQYDVKATATGVTTGTVVSLTIEGNADVPTTEVAEDGSILFDNVTLPPGKHTLKVDTASGDAHSADDYAYTYKALVIDAPHPGAAIGSADDTDPKLDGIQIAVSASSYAVLPSEDVSLLVDDKQVGKPVHVDANGKVVFTGVTLPTASHTLKVVAGAAESNPVRVSVNEACATVDFVSPAPPASGTRLMLGGGNSCPTGESDFAIDVAISTDAGDGRAVDLKVNGTTVQSTTVKGLVARFSSVVLNHRGTTANSLAVIVRAAQGATCKEVPFPADVFVDCQGASCSIGSPDPQPGVDALGQHVLYLNKSKLGQDGFDVRVDSDSSVLGKKVQLIIDRDVRNALTTDPKQTDAKVSALFSTVKLPEGAHTVEARCEDSTGNATYSGEATWVVDTKACSVHVTDPAADTRFVPADDVDANTSGVQVHVASTVGESDCSDTRAAVCKPADGIGNAVGFTAYDGGSSLTSTLTLEAGSQQTLCVEVRDRADNRALDSVSVKYQAAPPKVQIEAPANDDSYNVGGTNGHKPDSDPSSPTVCNANFDVLCSQLGTAVELHRDDAANPVIATGNCVEESGVPDGFAGRAHLPNVAFLPSNATTATIVATQQLQGVGQVQTATASVDLSGWCTIPAIDFFFSCPPSQMALPMGGGDLSAGTLQAAYAGNLSYAPGSATLTVTGSTTGKIGSDYVSTLMTDRYRFPNVNFGHTAETISTQLTATDSFDNTVQKTCMTTLVPDLPVLTVTSPANGAVFGPGQGCNSGVAGKFGVPIQATLDKTTDRQLTFSVGSAAPVTVPVSAVNTSVCVPANDGPNSITLRLSSTNGEGYATVTRSVSVNTITLSLPPTGAGLTAADDYCDPGFGAHVVATTDAIHAGATATVSNGTNTVQVTVSGAGAIDTCLQLAQGVNVITVSVDGTTASASSSVTVVSSPPSHPIPITTVTLPADNVYRTGKVTLAWAAPMEDFAGQLQKYELHCASTAILGTDNDVNKDAWWNAAESVVLPLDFNPPAAAVDVEFRIGETRHCVVRGRDAAQQLTPIPDSKSIDYAFRKQAVDTADLNKMGNTVARVGDVNGDSVADILAGGAGRAYLYFGKSGGLAGKAAPGSPDVTFVGAPGVAFYEFGSRTAGIGDFNRDGRNDFAIGFPGYNGSRGAAYLFYGRASGDAWPTTVDLSGPACQADVCFVGEEAAEFLGYALAPAGDFNNDGSVDFAVSAIGRDVGSDTLGGRLYVLLSHAYEASGNRSGTFWGTQISLPSDAAVGFYMDGTGAVSGDDLANTSQLGQAIAPVGNVDSTAGSDLLFSAAGKNSPAVTSKLLFLSGRTHNGLAPQLKPLTSNEAVLKDSGQANAFALRLVTYRNLINTTDSNVPDVLVGSGAQTFFNVYLGDQNSSSVRFAPDTKVRLNGETGTQFGVSVAATFNPNLASSSAGDLDADGLDELLLGTQQNSPSTAAGFGYLFYGDTLATAITAQTVSYTVASRVDPAARAGTLRRTVQYVGDVNGDGSPDLVVADPDAAAAAGGFTVLY
jgi:hypothetical protein